MPYLKGTDLNQFVTKNIVMTFSVMGGHGRVLCLSENIALIFSVHQMDISHSNGDGGGVTSEKMVCCLTDILHCFEHLQNRERETARD